MATIIGPSGTPYDSETGGEPINWSAFQPSYEDAKTIAAGLPAPVTNTAPTTNPTSVASSPTPSGAGNYPADQYIGWDPTAAQADWEAKQRGGGQPSGGGGQVNPYDAYRSNVEGVINTQYDAVFSGLDQMAGILPGMTDEWKANIDQMTTTQGEGLEIQKTAEQEKLAGSKEELRQKKGESQRAADTSMRNALLAGQVYLGSMGAGDSSAVGRYSGALAKAASRNTAFIQNKANEIWGQITQKESDVRTTFALAMNNLETWKNDKTNEITSWYNNALLNIEGQRQTARGEKAKALINLAQNAYSTALQRLAELQAEQRQYRAGIESWVAEKSETIGEFKSQLAELGNFQVGELPQTTLPGIQTGPAQQFVGGGAVTTPYLQQSAKDEESLRQFLT